MKKIIVSFIILFISNLAYGEITFVDGGYENIVADRLQGTWQPDENISEILDPITFDKWADLYITFEEDEDVLSEINDAENGSKLRYDVALSAGKLSVLREGINLWQDYIYYVLIQRNYNTVLAYFAPRKEDGKGTWKYSHVTLATARDQDNDLLFIGGDEKSEPMVSLMRFID